MGEEMGGCSKVGNIVHKMGNMQAVHGVENWVIVIKCGTDRATVIIWE